VISKFVLTIATKEVCVMMENVFVILNGQESYVLFQLVLKTAMDMGPAKITISVCVK